MPQTAALRLSAFGQGAARAILTRKISPVLGMSGKMMGPPAVNQRPRIPK
jgi:hypothetical protein